MKQTLTHLLSLNMKPSAAINGNLSGSKNKERQKVGGWREKGSELKVTRAKC